MAWNTNLRWRLPATCLLLEVAMVVLFGVFVRYQPDADARWTEDKLSRNVTSDLDNEFYYRYPSKSGEVQGSRCPAGRGPCLAPRLRPTTGGQGGIRRRCPTRPDPPLGLPTASALTWGAGQSADPA